MTEMNAERQQEFAVHVVRCLRDAGYQAYWAGGCVRDLLLGHTPKDYDVATDAQPEQVRKVFRRYKTLGIGASFGVIVVNGPSGAGQVEVATFREDLGYTDGRRPDGVRYSTAEEDAKRRDFTINGMFFDPLTLQTHDFVGGQPDLEDGVVRAIGDPHQRIEEDKLRMLRAVRFNANFGFVLETRTREAVEQMASKITEVSAERIRDELRKMLLPASRCRAMRLLRSTRLLQEVLPEVAALSEQPAPEGLVEPGDPHGGSTMWDVTLALLNYLEGPTWPVTLATVLIGIASSHRDQPGDAAARVARRLKCSTKEEDRVRWLVAQQNALDDAAAQPWSILQPILIHEGIQELLLVHAARQQLWANWKADSPQRYPLSCSKPQSGDIQFCRLKLQLPPEELNPKPLLNGDDLIGHGVPRGPIYRSLLQAVRKAQLNDQIRTRQQALALVDSFLATGAQQRDS